MIESVFNFILNFIMSMVELLLIPLDLIISQFIPDLSEIITSINEYLNLSYTYISFIVDFTFLSSFAVNLLFSFMLFKLTVPVSAYVIKLALNWWKKLF